MGSILQRLMKMARVLLDDCASASVTVVDGGRPVTAEFTDEVALDIDMAQYEVGAGPCLRALRQGKTVFADFSGAAWPRVSEAARRRNISTALSVPLTVGGVTVGGLNLYSPFPGGMSTEADQLAAGLLAEQGAVAMAASQAAAVERHTALTLQRSFLGGDLPVVTGYDLATHYDPASSTAEVGGDWYDAFRTSDDGPLAIVVGDATGHGLEAAALMSKVRTGLRAYAFEGHDPGNCLTLLSRLVGATATDTDLSFATACMVLMDTDTGMCRVASAGHPPAALREPDGTIRFIGGLGGPPLGLTGSEQVGEDFVCLEPGSALVLYTDGLVEDRRRGIEEGLEELAEALAGPVASARQLSDRLLDRLLGDRFHEDDVAMLVLLRLVR